MALSMDEQRILAEIEKRLAADDPGLASCLSTFRRPGPRTVLRSPRARIIGSLFTVLLVALVSLMVYAMIPFRAHTVRNGPSTPVNTAITAPGTQLTASQQTTISASTSDTSSTAASAPSRSAGHSPGAATPKAQETRANAASTSAAPAANP